MKFITPFVGAQVKICEAFDFQIPDGCAPVYVSKSKPTYDQETRPPSQAKDRETDFLVQKIEKLR